MQAFQNHEARLQAESLPLLLPHAKKIDDLTKTASRIGLQILGLHGHIANEEGGRAAGSNAKGISGPKGTFGCLRASVNNVPISTSLKSGTYTPSTIWLGNCGSGGARAEQGQRDGGDVPHQSARPGRKGSGVVNRLPASAFALVRWRAFDVSS
jgi:hypothetical protein